MSPQLGRDARVDAIDLTLSSPEPEARSHAQVYRDAEQEQQQQQQHRRVVKQESESSHRSTHDKNRKHGLTSSGSVLHQRSHRINPHHVKQIVDTSSSQALRHVVLQLCKFSPALSGAIARGLAPHSPWAQALIRGHHAQAKAQNQRESRLNERIGYENTKKHSGHGNTTQSAIVKESRRLPSATSDNHRPTAVPEKSDSLRVPSTSQKPTGKREHRTPTDSDDSTNIVDFAAVEREPRGKEYRYRAAAASSSRDHSSADMGSGGLVVRENSKDHNAPHKDSKLCAQCGELFKDGDMNCSYHPGPEAPSRANEVPQFLCCGKFVGEPGCTAGRHTSSRAGTMTNTKRPSPSPYSGLQWSKKPRVL